MRIGPPPNFVFILIDDMGYADLSCYGNKAVKTENIDRLAREGVRFTNYVSSAPICSPSRCGLLTGQYPQRWKITSFLETRKTNSERGMAQWLDPKAPSVARELKTLGYATGHFGKWHLGGQRDVGDAPLITEYGFDTSLTQFEGLGDRILPLLDAYDGKPAREYALGSDKLGRGKVTWVDRTKVTGTFAARAQEFMQQAVRQKKPFYVNLWLDDVHSPFFPEKDRRGDEAKRTLYNAVVQSMDDQLGPLLAYLRTVPNTIVILASDNGPEPGAGSAGPFRGQKGNLYEGGIREPLMVWGPGLVKPGITDDKTLITGVDLFPTVLKLAGKSLAHDGEDRSEAFLGKPQPQRTKPIFWERPPDRPGPPRNPFPDLAIRNGNWKLLCIADGSKPQLYDLATDPGEAKNRSTEEPERTKRLTEKLLEWKASLKM